MPKKVKSSKKDGKSKSKGKPSCPLHILNIHIVAQCEFTVPMCLSTQSDIDHYIDKRAKKEKDKDAPKKPISAFFCYQKTRRENLKKEDPKLDNKQLVAVMADGDVDRKCRRSGE